MVNCDLFVGQPGSEGPRAVLAYPKWARGSAAEQSTEDIRHRLGARSSGNHAYAVSRRKRITPAVTQSPRQKVALAMEDTFGLAS